jgi:hypothetical protein
MKTLIMRMMSIATLAIGVSMMASALAQSPASKLTDNSLDSRSVSRLNLFRSFATRRASSLQAAGLPLMNVLVGIGTTTPTSQLTVQGMIETTLGGLRFPDGTVQTTAVNSSNVVHSLNELRGDVTLAAGANISITPSGNTLTIAAPGALGAVAHDSTLMGNGTSASPLGLAVPLVLIGAVDDGNVNNGADGVVQVTNTFPLGAGIVARGNGFGLVGFGGPGAFTGVAGVGADTDTGTLGGIGLFGGGGKAANGDGGSGLIARGGEGNSAGNTGGIGINARGGEGKNGATNGLAGKFTGDVLIDGDLNVSGTKNFKIDHPLDPENKYLYHAAIESSEVLNVYSGNVTTNEQGEAVIRLPDWFEAINRDFRYQLTVVGTFAQAIVADEIKNNRFKIKTNAADVRVSWQVTGIRFDRAIRMRPFKAEEEKPERERGTYLSPEAFNNPAERSIEQGSIPEKMRQMKEMRTSTPKN